jgi:hypothetical protein
MTFKTTVSLTPLLMNATKIPYAHGAQVAPLSQNATPSLMLRLFQLPFSLAITLA